MNLIKKAITTLGGIFLAALLIAALAPKATHGLVAALVQVANTTATPVPNTDIKDQQPYQHTINFNQNAVNCYDFACTVTFDTVPAGYRLVVTSASAQYGLKAGGADQSVSLSTVNHTHLAHFLSPPVNIGFNTVLASGPITFYVDAGDAPVMTMSGQYVSDDNTFSSSATIVGYLVPVS